MRHPLGIPVCVASLALAGIHPAAAVEFPHRTLPAPPREFTCRLAGADLPLGAHACLTTPQGQHGAECAVLLNTSTWRPREGACS